LVLVFLLQKKKEKEVNGALSDIDMSVDELYIILKNGGKFFTVKISSQRTI
jgi:tricorn protease-like protein